MAAPPAGKREHRRVPICESAATRCRLRVGVLPVQRFGTVAVLASRCETVDVPLLAWLPDSNPLQPLYPQTRRRSGIALAFELCVRFHRNNLRKGAIQKRRRSREPCFSVNVIDCLWNVSARELLLFPF